MNVNLLKCSMMQHGDEFFINKLSELLNVSRQTIRNKLSGFSDFTQSEINIISKKYNLNAEEIKQIFFE